MNSPIVRLKLDAGWWWLEPWNFEWLSIFCWKCHNIPTDELTHSIIFFRVGRVFVLKTTNFQRLPHIPKEYPYKIFPPNHGDVHPMKSAVNLRLPGPPMRSAWSKAPREFDHPREFPTKSLREAMNSGDLPGKIWDFPREIHWEWQFEWKFGCFFFFFLVKIPFKMDFHWKHYTSMWKNQLSTFYTSMWKNSPHERRKRTTLSEAKHHRFSTSKNVYPEPSEVHFGAMIHHRF